MRRSRATTQLAARLAIDAGHLLVTLRDELTQAGAPAWQVMDSGDLASQRFLAQELAIARPRDAVLSEEGLEDPRRFEHRQGMDRRSVGWHQRVRRAAGRTGQYTLLCGTPTTSPQVRSAFPRSDLIFSTDPPAVVPQSGRSRPRLVTSRNRNPYVAVVIANALDADAVPSRVRWCQGDGRRHRRGRHLRARRWHVPVGLCRAGCSSPRRRTPRQPYRRITHGVQRSRSVAARSADMPTGVRRAGTRRATNQPATGLALELVGFHTRLTAPSVPVARTIRP